MLIDVHCHLDFFDDKEIDRVIDNARGKDVRIIVTQGTNLESNRKALLLGEKFKEIRVALGLYPIEALKIEDKEIDKEIDFIRKNKERIVAIGEVGLDFKETKDCERQKKVFHKLIELSSEIDRALIVHSRKAELECVEMLEKSKANKVVMHCFSGKLGLVKRIVENKWFISIPASVKNSEHFQKVIEITPIELLFCETDSPYLHPDRKFPNEPCNVLASYEMIARIKKLKLTDVEKQIERNYKRLFG